MTAHIGPQATAGAGTPAQAAHLAAELARLMDMVETERPGEPMLDKLAALVPEDLSEHWQKTIDFLKIVTASWPAYLAERGLLSPADRRNRAILAEARPLSGIAAERPGDRRRRDGLHSSDRRADARRRSLPHGAIVLPGLDYSSRCRELGHDHRRATRTAPPRASPIRAQAPARPPGAQARGRAHCWVQARAPLIPAAP